MYKKATKLKKADGYRLSIAIKKGNHILSTTRHFDKKSDALRFQNALKRGNYITTKRTKLGILVSVKATKTIKRR